MNNKVIARELVKIAKNLTSGRGRLLEKFINQKKDMLNKIKLITSNLEQIHKELDAISANGGEQEFSEVFNVDKINQDLNLSVSAMGSQWRSAVDAWQELSRGL